MSHGTPGSASFKSRLATEMKNYALISSYLFICFSVILLYEASLVPEAHSSLLAHGLALGKALVIGKFILIGEALDAGNRMKARTLLHRVAYRSVGMLVVLLVLKLAEELILGWVHGRSAGEVIGEMIGTPWLGILAPVLLMLLILIPLITATEINRALSGQLAKLMLGQENRSAGSGSRSG